MKLKKGDAGGTQNIVESDNYANTAVAVRPRRIKYRVTNMGPTGTNGG